MVKDQKLIQNLRMAYIKELIQSLFEEDNEGNIESFKKLIYLSVNQPQLFNPHALELANTICPILQCIEDTTTKIYALQLLSELATNYTQQIPPKVYDFQQPIALLSDQNTEVRKAAHYLLLIFIKKYERIDEIIEGYLIRIKENADQWKQIQKIIHSFQSLLVIEPKSVTYPLDFNFINSLLRLLIGFRMHQHSLIQKAAEQTIASFLKNEYTHHIFHKLDKNITLELVSLSEKLGVNLQNKPTQFQRKSPEKVKTREVLNQLDKLLEKMKKESDWKIKSQIIEDISKKFQGEENWKITQNFIEGILDYTYDYNFKICITAMNIILTLMAQYPQDVKGKLKKIEDVMVEKICDLKMAVRQIAAKILKKIFDNGNIESARKLLSKMSNCSVVGKQQILLFLQDYYSNAVPSDLNLILNEVAGQLSNQNTKIKIKTLDCLVKISVSSSINDAKYILQKKLNRVYYDMFLERLKERQPETKSQRWDDSKNNKMNKGMTWQAERSPNYTEPENNKYLTKFQFAKKVDKSPQQDTFYQFKYDAPTFGGMEKTQPRQQKVMLGTSHTSNKTQSIYDNRKQQNTGLKFNKKVSESSKPNMSSSSNVTSSMDAFEEYSIQEKKLPLKPKPVKKNVTSNQMYKEESNNLVIHSKEYQNKNPFDDVPEQKVEVKPPERKVKPMKLTKTIAEKPETSEKYIDDDRTMNKSAKEPFSIKKTGIKKDHQVDYKATQYVSKEELAPVHNPKELLKDIISNLPNNNDWSKQFDCLDGLRRLIKNHEEFYPQIHQNVQTIMPEVLKLVESLRSSLAKNAMITLAEMCQALKKSMDPFLQAIFLKLFKKAQDTNSFIIEEVNKCIRSLCSYCSNAKIIGVITNNSQAKAIPIKLKVALTVRQLLEKEHFNIHFLKDNTKLVGIMGNYITDGSQQVRNITKQTFLEILGNNSQQQVQGLFRKSSKQIWQKWRNIIDRDLK